MTQESIYLLPGRGRQLTEGLGSELIRRGYSLRGRDLESEFGKYPFEKQLEIVREDLANYCWSDSSKVIAISFGAYLFLQAQAEISPYIGRVLLLSPIIGEVINLELGRYFIPPQSKRIELMTSQGLYPIPKQLEIHVGEKDWQCPIEVMKEIALQWKVKLSVVPEQEHRLNEQYVGKILDSWL
ncbi:hypothetical protein [Thorsellia anophelis]|uniref:Alpha/beta hydrolase n=1 Tax=Thorsellia anophelis DSM 18579 TaxID=1123402 RepID=A0A1I0E784_9GAMM|nr:hypothetical protein [Thorsellia anophelis]SET40700.1 hypothetical protein SAMN02583745_02272 [Thorsellia anophelis DSM 18579]